MAEFDKFTNARTIEQIVWSMRLAEWERGLNRARINSLANGAPPYTSAEEERNGIAINVNDLSLTRLSHDARLQLYQAFNKPGNFFKAQTDGGAVHKRMGRGVVVTKAINKCLKHSDNYFECFRSQFAQQVLHGIGPALWEDEDLWCPEPVGIEDVLMPSNTRLTFKGLPFTAIWRGFSIQDLCRWTRGPRRDPGWNMPVVEQTIKWAQQKTQEMFGNTPWGAYWSPEKQQELLKSDGGLFASDLVQTIDCFDFYYWDDSGKKEGWRRKIIFDAEGGAASWIGENGYGSKRTMPDKNLLGDDKGMFLYDSGNRVWGSKISEIIHFQFADLSSVAPFRYHTVRSLGFMLYAVCHLQNRLRCKFGEAVFETLLPYLRVNSLDDAERALKVQMASKGIIDSTVQFLSPQERWQPNVQLTELGMQEYKQIIADNSASYVQNNNFARDRVEKTKFQVMAEVNAMTTLVSSALQQAYRYQASQYREIFRRFMKENSRDPEVRHFRATVLAAGVPKSLLNVEAWDIEPERIVGGGNKTQETAIAQILWEWMPAFPPEGQQIIKRIGLLAVTDDASLANSILPESPSISDSRHDAMLAFGSLMVGGAVRFRSDTNSIDIVEVLLAELTLAIQRVIKTGGMATKPEVMGFQNVLMHISEQVALIAKNPPQKEQAKRYAEASGKLANEVKGMVQRLAEQGDGENGDGEAAALQMELYKQKTLTDAKAANMRESHGARTAQKQVQFDMSEERKGMEHTLSMQRQAQEDAMDLRFKAMEAKIDILTSASKAKNSAKD